MQIRERAKTVLYEYTIEEEIESFVEETEIDKETGEEITRKKKTIEKRPVEVRFYRPTSREVTAAELRRTIAWNWAVKQGMLPKKAITNVYNEMGGILDKKMTDEFASAAEKSVELRSRLQFLGSKEEKTEEEIAELDKLMGEYREVAEMMANVENYYITSLSNSADSFADQEKFKFFMLNCSWIKEFGENTFKKIFSPTKTNDIQAGFAEQVEKYELATESDDPVIVSILDRMIRVYSIYNYNNLIDPENLKSAMDSWYNEEKIEKDVEEIIENEEPKKEVKKTPARKKPTQVGKKKPSA